MSEEQRNELVSTILEKVKCAEIGTGGLTVVLETLVALDNKPVLIIEGSSGSVDELNAILETANKLGVIATSSGINIKTINLPRYSSLSQFPTEPKASKPEPPAESAKSMELFTVIGNITLDDSEYHEKIDTAIEKAEKLAELLDKIGDMKS